MVYSHWELHKSPYAAGIDPRTFYQSTESRRGLGPIALLADQPRRTGLLLGGSGVGKTLLLEVFRSANPLVHAAGCHAELARHHDGRLSVATRLEVGSRFASHRVGVSTLAVRSQINCARTDTSAISTVLLLDDADEAHSEVLMQVAGMRPKPTWPKARLTMVLAAQPQRLANLGSRLLELSDLRIDLEPWSEPETMAYLLGTGTGRSRQATFTPEAMRHIHRLAGGTEGVKQLADMAHSRRSRKRFRACHDEVVEGVFRS